MTSHWYLGRENRQKFGPYSMVELKHFAVSRVLHNTDMVLEVGTRTWVEASSVLELFPKWRALSIRQPFAELIMLGKKPIEYRSWLTHIRGPVYIYACKTRGRREDYEKNDLNTEALPHGVLLGTVELVDCLENYGEFEWRMTKPQRLVNPLQVKAMPQPGFFWPFGK